MTSNDLVSLRLYNQKLVGSPFKTPKEVLGYMGAIQAQDYAMAKWAIGMRMEAATERTVDSAIDKGLILRTHVLRPTWHFISADDIYWMLELTGPRIKMAMKSRNKELGLSDAIFKQSNRIISKALDTGQHLTREALLTKLKAAKMATDDNRASHLFMHAELDGIICSGASQKNKRSYALLENLVPKKKSLKKEEALAKLAGIYFKSRGPATLADFAWWSGLSLGEAKAALELVKADFVQETVGTQTYWFRDIPALERATKNTFKLLPAFDEFLISYKDRTASIHPDHQKKAFSSNGIFWPTLLVNGKVTGLWKRSINKEKVLVETDYFHPHTTRLKSLFKKSVNSFGHFLEKEAEVVS